MSILKKGFNMFAEGGTALNRMINQAIGKDVFKDIKKIEEPREFPPYDSFPKYFFAEPEQWPSLKGKGKGFTLSGNVILVPSELDACIKYRPYFKQAAEYYTKRFKFKYQNCVKDFDSLIHYSEEMYIEGLTPMCVRAYSLLLPFGVFTANVETFISVHVDHYNKAITSYDTMAGIERTKNQSAENLGNQVGGAIQMQGGGFGFKGAMKGVAQAEAFNLGMGLVGKFVANQSKMTQEEKAKAFAAFRSDIFFEEVYSDYYNTFLTFVQLLVDNGVLNGINTVVSAKDDAVFNNVLNPMFPQDKMAMAFAKLISCNPFVPKYFVALEQKLGQTDEVKQIVNYFSEPQSESDR